MDAVIYVLAGKDVIQMVGGDRLSKLTSKSVLKLKRSKKGKALIKKQFQKIMKWKQKKSPKRIKKSNKKTKKKTVKRKR